MGILTTQLTSMLGFGWPSIGKYTIHCVFGYDMYMYTYIIPSRRLSSSFQSFISWGMMVKSIPTICPKRFCIAALRTTLWIHATGLKHHPEGGLQWYSFLNLFVWWSTEDVWRNRWFPKYLERTYLLYFNLNISYYPFNGSSEAYCAKPFCETVLPSLGPLHIHLAAVRTSIIS